MEAHSTFQETCLVYNNQTICDWPDTHYKIRYSEQHCLMWQKVLESKSSVWKAILVTALVMLAVLIAVVAWVKRGPRQV